MTEAELSAMPLLIINMGGEMLYILEQRLKAQNIPEDKGQRVHQDVMSTMFSEQFIRELFKPQKIYSNSSTRLIFDRLAHSSIMRLNESSMNKLYDLMTMGTKYQVLAATHAEQLEHASLNHLEALRKMIKGPEVLALLDAAIAAAHTLFRSLQPGDWLLLRQTLARFFQDRRIKVSLFLHDGIQSTDGSIIIRHTGPLPPGAEKPGTIRYYDDEGNETEATVLLKNGTELLDPVKRSTLGENLYAKDRRKKDKHTKHKNAPTDQDKPYEPNEKGQKAAKAELTYLANLLGNKPSSQSDHKFKLEQLFPDVSDGAGGGEQVIVFDQDDQNAYKDWLTRGFWGDDTEEKKDGGEEEEDDMDLLDLMDLSDIFGAMKSGASASGGAMGPNFKRDF